MKLAGSTFRGCAQTLCMLSLLMQSALTRAEDTVPDVAAGCGPMTTFNRMPPMDYRNDRKMLAIVEYGHFQPQVENLVKPMQGSFGGDLDYTLYAYPNHIRALVTLLKLGEREKTEKPAGSSHSIDCYFRRALRFRSDDLVVRMLYATYLSKRSRIAEAIAHLDYVSENASDNPFTYYNAGLIYFELKEYDKALARAHRAMELGLPRTELQDQLKAVGRWREPSAAASALAASATTAASAPAAEVR